MHLKIDKETKNIIAYDKQENIRHIMCYKVFLTYYNSDLFDILIKHGEYKTKYHNTPQLDINI